MRQAVSINTLTPLSLSEYTRTAVLCRYMLYSTWRGYQAKLSVYYSESDNNTDRQTDRQTGV